MNLKDIQKLIEFVSRRDFDRFEMEDEGFKIKLVRGRGAEVGLVPAAAKPAAAAPVVDAAPGVAVAADVAAAAAGLHEVKSPIVGTFFRAPNPQSDSFVENGSVVAAGQPLCIVEAMKLMNEIESDVAGEIVEILVANGQPVEYGEVLFRIRPRAA